MAKVFISLHRSHRRRSCCRTIAGDFIFQLFFYFFVNRIALDGEILNGLCGSQNEAHFSHSEIFALFLFLSHQMFARSFDC